MIGIIIWKKRVLSIGGRSLKDAPVYIETNEGHKKTIQT